MDEKTEEHKENPLFQLDVVLAFLYQRIGLIFPSEQVTKAVSDEIKVNESDVILILQKLKKDKYIDEYTINKPNDNRVIPATVIGYSINFNGKLFLKRGGYNLQAINNDAENNRLKNLENDQRASRNQMNFLTAVIAAGTLVAAIYYGIEIYKELHLFAHHHGTYWIWETIPKKTG
ncbi:hypothetical protein BH09BAC6_BH09BAC6_26070 [soil metagenome]|jgi:hypothetical protein